METRADFEALDRKDALAGMRELFDIPPGVIYLDGNSLGAFPRATRGRLAGVVEGEWREGLIRSWTEADWMQLPHRIGDKIAKLVGANAGEVVAGDSTSVNLFKALSMALALAPKRSVILTERGNFPTDLYIAEGLIAQLGGRHRLVAVEGSEEAIEAALIAHRDEVAAVMLTHVNFTTARIYDMARVTRAVHSRGATVVWDLSHSTGAVEVNLGGAAADFAVGCGYKYLNGGPGAPAFLYVPRRHQHLTQPISGWMGHAKPFEFRADYEPAKGMSRFLSGTPGILALAALECGVDSVLQAPIAALRQKSRALTGAFMRLVARECPDLHCVTPVEEHLRGSHVSLRHPEAPRVVRDLTARGVIGDSRPPDLMRFGFAPLYVRHVDVWDTVQHLRAAI